MDFIAITVGMAIGMIVNFVAIKLFGHDTTMIGGLLAGVIASSMIASKR